MNISTTTPQELPETPKKTDLPIKIYRQGWICPLCGSSINPDLFFCPNCQNRQYIDNGFIHRSFTVCIKNDPPIDIHDLRLIDST